MHSGCGLTGQLVRWPDWIPEGRLLNIDLASSSRTQGGPWIYAAAWLPFLTLYAAALIANDVSLSLAVRNAVVHVLPDAVLGMLVLRLPQRLPWPDSARARFFALHGALLVAFVLACVAGWLVLIGFDALLFDGAFRIEVNPGIAIWHVLNDVLIYGMLAALSYAWHNAAASRAQAARAARAEALQARTQLEALRSQLNPHFILNTFHALIGLVRRDPAVAEEALERLGDLLRYVLRVQREGQDEVTLREEWSIVGAYVEIERLRLGDRLHTCFDLADDALDGVVPSFAVQTLVENAVRHAIASRADGGRLSVVARRKDDRLLIRVDDPGVGIAMEPDRGAGNGIGLRLLRERLAALYDGFASLEVRVAPDGSQAILDIPQPHARADHAS